MTDAKANGEAPSPPQQDTLTRSEGRVAMVQLARAVGVEDVTPQDTMVEVANEIAAEFEALSQRVAELEQQVDTITDLSETKSSKGEKVAAILKYAQNRATDPQGDRVVLRPEDIQGVAGVKQRYSYTLIDTLPDEYAFFLSKDDVKQYGDMQIDKSSQRKALIVDLAQVQRDDGELCLHNNGRTKEGGR